MSLLSSRAGRYAPFPTVGTRVGGRVTRDAEEMQQREFRADGSMGDLLFWDDGKPRMMLVVTVQTDEREDSDDDGQRSIYVKGQMLTATKAAVKPHKRDVIREGDFFAVTFTAEVPLPKGKKGYPAKVYEVEFSPGQPTTAGRRRMTPFSDGTPVPDEPPF